MTDPFLAEVTLRAWGTDDPRVLDSLPHENQAGWRRRETAIGERAADAGWPTEAPTISQARAAQKRALQRLERAGGLRFGRQYKADGTDAYESRRRGAITTTRGGVLPVDEEDTGGSDRDDNPATIFDEEAATARPWSGKAHSEDLFSTTAFLRSKGRTSPDAMLRRDTKGIDEDDPLDGPATTIYDE